MNWKLLFQLSMFGMGMAIATVFLIPSNIEPFFWLAIFLTCAYLIAKKANGKYFAHGFMLSLLNCVWVTGIHVILMQQYLNNHPEEAVMMSSMPFDIGPRTMMLITGPIIGIISGLVQGLFAFVASRLLKKN